ncbi:helix-turn-helix domain-containing protein [Paraliobacillus salinarum]|uniref:helix-turn-helix domain-containing protein n=1 Tax=Paraliobacillus salinarum TaxID=1158996 RepID=UPI003CCDF8F8
METLAKKANSSTYHFIRTFTKETGVTPYQYVMNTRIAAARFLLKASDASIKDIAFSTGFQSESSFCTCFKKIEQLTPSQYRKQID